MARKKKKKQSPLLWIVVVLAALLVLELITALSIFLFTSFTQNAPSSESLSRNEYHPESFYMQDNFLHYRDGNYLLGTDVSAHQGLIDWKKVSATGIDFAILRIGYRGSTLGEIYEDEQFRYNLEQAQKYGLQIGVYFFSQALTAEEAAEEARYVCAMLNGENLDLPVYFDWEFIGGRVESIDSVPLTDCAVAFCEEIKARGHTPGVYFNLDFAYNRLNMRRLQDYQLWLAEYNETPTYRYRFDCLQFTDRGTLSGIETPVDLDMLFLDATS